MADAPTSDDRLSTEQRAEMLARIEAGLNATAAGFKRGMMWVGLLFFVMAAFFVVKGAYAIGLVVAAGGSGIMAIGTLAARNTAPARMKPVLEALSVAPGLIASVRHYETADSARMFVSHWIEIKTADHRLVLKANDDWQGILEYLIRHCPKATVDRGPGA